MSAPAVPAPSSYCDAAAHPVHRPYHDDEYGVPVRDDAALFERLVLEINQAGLAWETVLRKRATLRAAYAGFDPARVAAFDDADRARLLADPGVIRNRLKVNAAIENARRVLLLRASHGSFAAWLDAHHPLGLDEWQRLFRRTFVFTGGQIVRELLVSTGYLPGAHRESCPAYARVLRLSPPWAS
jgi:DNA-3-methyladenine glycosylase I